LPSTLIRQRALNFALLSLTLILAAYLRLANLSHNPGWYSDEGTHLDIARHLLDGRSQYLAVTQSTLLFAKMPLFDLLLAAVMRVTGSGITVLRGLTGVLGVISVGLLYVVVKHIQRRNDEVLPLLAALMLAIYPQAVLYSRFGFSYNLLVPLVLFIML
jgi:4-amino-4-deoxy-L-arabinose transferase-like glycosyltransferase